MNMDYGRLAFSKLTEVNNRLTMLAKKDNETVTLHQHIHDVAASTNHSFSFTFTATRDTEVFINCQLHYSSATAQNITAELRVNQCLADQVIQNASAEGINTLVTGVTATLGKGVNTITLTLNASAATSVSCASLTVAGKNIVKENGDCLCCCHDSNGAVIGVYDNEMLKLYRVTNGVVADTPYSTTELNAVRVKLFYLFNKIWACYITNGTLYAAELGTNNIVELQHGVSDYDAAVLGGTTYFFFIKGEGVLAAAVNQSLNIEGEVSVLNARNKRAVYAYANGNGLTLALQENKNVAVYFSTSVLSPLNLSGTFSGNIKGVCNGTFLSLANGVASAVQVVEGVYTSCALRYCDDCALLPDGTAALYHNGKIILINTEV